MEHTKDKLVIYCGTDTILERDLTNKSRVFTRNEIETNYLEEWDNLTEKNKNRIIKYCLLFKPVVSRNISSENVDISKMIYKVVDTQNFKKLHPKSKVNTQQLIYGFMLIGFNFLKENYDMKNQYFNISIAISEENYRIGVDYIERLSSYIKSDGQEIIINEYV